MPVSRISQPDNSHRFIHVTNARVSSINSTPSNIVIFSSPRHTGCQIRKRPRWINIRALLNGLPKSSRMEKCSSSSIAASSSHSLLG